MSTRTVTTFGIVIAVLLALVSAQPAQARPGHPWPGHPVYLALGDSTAAGTGAIIRATGYVGLLAAALRISADCAPGYADDGPGRTCRGLQLVDLAVGGATTATLIADQLGPAVDLLHARNHNRDARDDVRFVTLTIGGNDVNNPILAACFGIPAPVPDDCTTTVDATLTTFSENIGVILASLRAAAGPDTVIVATAYANPLVNPRCPIHALADFADLILDGGPVIVTPAGPVAVDRGLNDRTRDAASSSGVLVAEAFGVLGPWRFQPDCLHPNQAGHLSYARLFADAFLR